MPDSGHLVLGRRCFDQTVLDRLDHPRLFEFEAERRSGRLYALLFLCHRLVPLDEPRRGRHHRRRVAVRLVQALDQRRRARLLAVSAAAAVKYRHVEAVRSAALQPMQFLFIIYNEIERASARFAFTHDSSSCDAKGYLVYFILNNILYKTIGCFSLVVYI